MSKLVLTLDGALLGEYPLEKKYVTLGRRASNDIQIDNLAISGDHARFITLGDETLIEDLESTNGSQINGKKVQKQPLRHGDVVSIGKYKLTFVNEAGNGPVSVDGFENTILIQASDEDGFAEEAVADAAAPAETVRPARVQVLNGPATGKEMELTKTLTTLGKAGGQVAVITRRPQGYFITHVEGEQTPEVNGAAISMQAHPLADHDVIDLAGVKMEFYLAEQ
jgi:predicted component of type VI protein secretion system